MTAIIQRREFCIRFVAAAVSIGPTLALSLLAGQQSWHSAGGKVFVNNSQVTQSRSSSGRVLPFREIGLNCNGSGKATKADSSMLHFSVDRMLSCSFPFQWPRTYTVVNDARPVIFSDAYYHRPLAGNRLHCLVIDEHVCEQ